MKPKIAVVQFELTQWQPESNIAKMENFIIQAKQQNADIIIFPEDCVTGPILRNPKMVDTEQKYSKIFSQLAAKHSIDLIPGSWMESDPNLQGWYSTTYYFDHTGAQLARYLKINLWISERAYITPGHQTATFQTRFGTAGLVICWDLMFPELFRKMLSQGVQMVFCPSNWSLGLAGKGLAHNPTSERTHVDALCQARAIENNLFLIYSNVAGQDTYSGHNDEMVGHSQITAPFYGTIKKLPHSQEEMFIQQIDLDLLKTAEQEYKTREDFNSNQ